MRILLDTHIFLWYITGNSQLPPKFRAASSLWLGLLLILLTLTCEGGAFAAEWYIAPTGDDSAAGDLEHPFAGLRRAQAAASPGDTVHVRGGKFSFTNDDLAAPRGVFARAIVLDKSGLPERPITYAAYRDERPVFDFTAVTPANKRVTAFYVAGSHLRLSGLDVVGVQVTMKGHTQSICFESQGSHNVFERLSMHDGQAIGIYHVRGSDNLFLNCDAWNNWDRTSEDGKGGNVDGFGGHPTPGSRGNVFRGCRAWHNSDDGFDCISAHEAVTFEDCLALANGYAADKTSLADGNGFKAGGYASLPAKDWPRPIPRHIIRRCVAVGNKNSGFYANHHPGGCDWLYNTAFQNAADFNLLGRTDDNRADIDGIGHILRNNVSFGGRRDLTRIDREKCELAGNSFTLGLKLTARDFVSLDTAELLRPRSANGAWTEIDCLRPAADSALVGRAVRKNPNDAADLGAFPVRTK